MATFASSLGLGKRKDSDAYGDSQNNQEEESVKPGVLQMGEAGAWARTQV
ncbi:MAG TPA: hypothetical protein VGY98_07425 [Verrucomicrobiae bacterium]|nr:hypothetical protein [Verrucomicrobiae bacterium]